MERYLAKNAAVEIIFSLFYKFFFCVACTESASF